jgi:hypothetical protein
MLTHNKNTVSRSYVCEIARVAHLILDEVIISRSVYNIRLVVFPCIRSMNNVSQIVRVQTLSSTTSISAGSFLISAVVYGLSLHSKTHETERASQAI